MKSNHIIVVVSPVVETWGNLTKLCEAKGWKYNTVNNLKFPFTYKGLEIHKTIFN